MGLPKKKSKIEEQAIWDKVSKGDRSAELILVYDEASILLFDKPQRKPKKKE